MKFEKQNHLLKLLKSTSNANRLKILQILAEAKTPINVTALVDRLEISQATLSNHLALLRRDGIVAAKQDGQNMYYSIKDLAALKLLKILD
jgi:DNA-binding transcriptional ArsR family regulator